MATFSIGSEFLFSVLLKQSLERKQGWGTKEVKKRGEEKEWGILEQDSDTLKILKVIFFSAILRLLYFSGSGINPCLPFFSLHLTKSYSLHCCSFYLEILHFFLLIYFLSLKVVIPCWHGTIRQICLIFLWTFTVFAYNYL